MLVGLADGPLSTGEPDLLRPWREVFQKGQDTIHELLHATASRDGCIGIRCYTDQHPALLEGVRRWLVRIEPPGPEVPGLLVRLTPGQYPFAREGTLFD